MGRDSRAVVVIKWGGLWGEGRQEDGGRHAYMHVVARRWWCVLCLLLREKHHEKYGPMLVMRAGVLYMSRWRRAKRAGPEASFRPVLR